MMNLLRTLGSVELFTRFTVYSATGDKPTMPIGCSINRTSPIKVRFVATAKEVLIDDDAQISRSARGGESKRPPVSAGARCAGRQSHRDHRQRPVELNGYVQR